MGRKSSVLKAKEQILKDPIFNNDEYFINFSRMFELFESSKHSYSVSPSMSFMKFINELKRHEILDSSIDLPEGKRSIFIKHGYNKNSSLLVALASSINSYLSYMTAISIHELSLQIPKNIYLINERYGRYNSNEIHSQEAIDNAFKKKSKTTSNSFTFESINIYKIQGNFTDRLGVIKRDGLYYTDIERTLIDIIVRPHYSGGLISVFNAYLNAKGKVDVNKMYEYYLKLDFTYPYRQSIGFILEKAGYKKSEVDLFILDKWSWKFYLLHNMHNTKFSEKWNLYYPSGF